MGGLVLSQPASSPTAVLVGCGEASLLPADTLLTSATIGAATSTQNMRPLPTTVWAGNRLQQIHRYLAAPATFGAGVGGRTLPVLLGHQGRGWAGAGVTPRATLTPVAITNLGQQGGAAYPTQVTGWASAALHTSHPTGLSRPSQALLTGAAATPQSRVHGLGVETMGGLHMQPRSV